MNINSTSLRYKKVFDIHNHSRSLRGQMLEFIFSPTNSSDIICESTIIDYYDSYGNPKKDRAGNVKIGDFLIEYI